MEEIILIYSLISGIFSILLFSLTLFFEKDKKRSRILLIWAILFLFSAFITSEYAFWVQGYNLFEIVFSFNFPLIVFFITWIVFIIWLFESRKERKIWIILLILMIIGIIIAVNCMNCISFK